MIRRVAVLAFLCSAATGPAVCAVPARPAPRTQLAERMSLQAPRRPVVKGLRYAVAESTLRVLGITVVRRDSLAERSLVGLVLDQRPSARTFVTRGAVDTLVVGVPALGGVVRVPSVVGESYAAAAERMRRAGLVAVGPALSPEDSARAIVTRVDASSTDPLRRGSAVGVTVAIDPAVAVPPVVGRDTAAAREILTKGRLLLGGMSSVYDEKFPPGAVTHQAPPAGDSARPGDRVHLLVSQGPHPERAFAVVPSVIGTQLGTAEQLLARRSLIVGHVDSLPEPGGSGRVAHQFPHAGDTAHVGDAVRLTLATAAVTVRVPDLFGMTLEQAKLALAPRRLALGRVQMTTEPGAAPISVLRQNPEPESVVPEGTAVDVEFNVWQLRQVVVPPVEGLPLVVALGTLAETELHPQTSMREGGRPDTVLTQSPAAGDTVAAGSVVELVVGAEAAMPDARVSVPPLTERPVADALRDAAGSGFRNFLVDSLPVLEGAAVAGWVVTDQAPSPGERVLPATLIQLIARAVPALRVPTLLGFDETVARNEAAEAGFTLAVGGRSVGLRLVNSVVSAQVPAGETTASAGASITVVMTDPLPLPITLSFAAVGFAGLALWFRTRWPSGQATKGSRGEPERREREPEDHSDEAPESRLRFRRQVKSRPPEVEGTPGRITGPGLSFRTRLNVGAPEVERPPTESFVAGGRRA